MTPAQRGVDTWSEEDWSKDEKKDEEEKVVCFTNEPNTLRIVHKLAKPRNA